MKVKKVLPLLAAAWLCAGAAGAVFAEEHGTAASHEQATVHEAHNVPAGHDQDAAHAEGEAAHGESHGGGHAAPMITGE
ncbi:hypothetical protein VU05_01615, partial [Desulfobulbus sp. F1]|nr:hypothetical protein [Desulfobulbus sp. F1]